MLNNFSNIINIIWLFKKSIIPNEKPSSRTSFNYPPSPKQNYNYVTEPYYPVIISDPEITRLTPSFLDSYDGNADKVEIALKIAGVLESGVKGFSKRLSRYNLVSGFHR